MIRRRQSNGDVIQLSQDEAIEVVDSDGRLGLVVMRDHKDTVRVMTPGDPLFAGYCRTNGMKPAKVHFHDPFEGQTMGG